jgi:hypothetical protein
VEEDDKVVVDKVEEDDKVVVDKVEEVDMLVVDMLEDRIVDKARDQMMNKEEKKSNSFLVMIQIHIFFDMNR